MLVAVHMHHIFRHQSHAQQLRGRFYQYQHLKIAVVLPLYVVMNGPVAKPVDSWAGSTLLQADTLSTIQAEAICPSDYRSPNHELL